MLLALLLPRVTQADPSSWRPIVLSELPPGHMAELRISAGVPMLVRFESELDPAGTRLREAGPSPFESLDVSGRLLLLHPSASAWLWPRMHLQVRRMDGTNLTLVLVSSPPGSGGCAGGRIPPPVLSRGAAGCSGEGERRA